MLVWTSYLVCLKLGRLTDDDLLFCLVPLTVLNWFMLNQVMCFLMQGSWNEAICNGFKYVRKYENKKRRVSPDGCQSNANTEKTASEQPKTKMSRRCDFWNVVPSLEGTTAAIHKEHLLELEKENCKQVSSQDSGKIKALMEATYQIRRKDILTTAIPVKDIIKKYPALATISGVI